MELKTLFLGKGELDVSRINEFISSMTSARVVLFFSSIKEEDASSAFFDSCSRNLDLPFLGVGTVGTITRDGYKGEGVVVGVLSGEFNAEVFSIEVDYDGPYKTAKTVSEKLGSTESCMVFHSCPITHCLFVNEALAKIHEEYPQLILWGGMSAGEYGIATKEGRFSNHLGFITFSGVEVDFSMGTGFTLDEQGPTYTVGKRDIQRIYGIEGQNASQRYCQIQHMQSWMINRFLGLVSRNDVIGLMKMMSSLNKTLYEGFMRAFVKLLGFKLEDGTVTPMAVSYVGEDCIHPIIYVREGTKLYMTKSKAQDQLDVYDKLKKELGGDGPVLVSSCMMRQFYINFEFDKVKEKMDGFGKPYIVAYFPGEIGVYPGMKSKNIYHNCTVQAIGFK